MKTYFSNERWVQAYAFFLRTLVFVQEQGIDPVLEFDSLDTTDRQYVVITDRGKPIGTVRYQLSAKATLQPDRLCVLASYRRQRVGQQLMQAIETQGRAEGCTHSVLSAAVSAISFYQKMGYQTIGNDYLEDGVTCIQMEKELPT